MICYWVVMTASWNIKWVQFNLIGVLHFSVRVWTCAMLGRGKVKFLTGHTWLFLFMKHCLTSVNYQLMDSFIVPLDNPRLEKWCCYWLLLEVIPKSMHGQMQEFLQWDLSNLPIISTPKKSDHHRFRHVNETLWLIWLQTIQYSYSCIENYCNDRAFCLSIIVVYLQPRFEHEFICKIIFL